MLAREEKQAIGDWRLAIGDWRLAIGDWEDWITTSDVSTVTASRRRGRPRGATRFPAAMTLYYRWVESTGLRALEKIIIWGSDSV